MHPFRKLLVWQDAHRFALACYAEANAIADRSVRWQLQRAAQSIPANIAEGAGSQSQMEFARYLGIAIASAKETEYHLLFALDAELLSPSRTKPLQSQLEQVIMRLNALRRAIRSNAKRRTRPESN
jgi:four helix bundle protein